MKYRPHEYQKEAIKFLISHGSAGLFQDPGLGKTSETYAAFDILRSEGLVSKMLVIAPLRPAQSVWPREALKWDEFKKLRVVVLHGPKKDELLDSNADVYIINPAGLGWLSEAMRRRKWWWDMLVVDESTKFKHTTTQQFKLLKALLPKFRRRYILTGSPAPNGLLDLFGQVYILDMGNALHPYITRYRNEFFYSTGFGGYTWLPQPGAEERIYERLAPLVLRMAAEDYLELPELVFNTVEIELDEGVMRTYRQMEDLMLATLGDKMVTAANAGAATNKCRQIANGGIYHEGGEKFTNLHKQKAEAVVDLVEQLQGKPALVAYEYKHDLDRLQRAFKGKADVLGSGMSAREFKSIEDRWNKGDIPVLLAQPQSVAHGLNLQGTGAAVIFHSIPWDLEVDEQFIRRVWRQGQTERVVVHRIVAKDTVDEAVLAALGRKDKTQRALLAALKDYAKGRRRG